MFNKWEINMKIGQEVVFIDKWRRLLTGTLVGDYEFTKGTEPKDDEGNKIELDCVRVDYKEPDDGELHHCVIERNQILKES